MKIDKEIVKQMAVGSIILGAGGGGSAADGEETALSALELGAVELKSVDEFKDDDIVVTISGVGSPASKESFSTNEDYNLILKLLTEKLGRKPAALIPSEMGGSSSFGPFVAAAMNQIPILDAACNGRAHPLGTMGAMGLNEKQNYETIQAAIGGNPEKNRHIEMVATGSVSDTASLVRSAAVRAGGLVVVARNPVTVGYVKEHAAVGCYSQSIKLGKSYLEGKTADEKIKNVIDFLNGRIMCRGKITNYNLETRNGLDVGGFEIISDTKAEIAFWNEFMSVSVNGKRVYTFPDFMMTFDAETGLPVTTAEIENGKDVILTAASCKNLILGGGMYEKSSYKAVEEALEIDMFTYVKNLIK